MELSAPFAWDSYRSSPTTGIGIYNNNTHAWTRTSCTPPFQTFYYIRERNRERWERLIYISYLISYILYMSLFVLFFFVWSRTETWLFTHLIGIDRERFLYILELCFSFFLSFFLSCLCSYSLFPAGQKLRQCVGGKIIDGWYRNIINIGSREVRQLFHLGQILKSYET